MNKRSHHESGAAVEEPPVTPEVEPAEPQTVEQEPLRESVDTVRQLMDAWKNEYDATDDGKRKAELAYRMVRMDQAIQAAHLSPDEVKIREAEAGVLGFYVPSTGEIAITTAGLELNPIHFKDVLVHEALHAGKLTTYRISDEGLTQLETERRVPGGMSGIYEGEKKDVEIASEKVGFQRMLEVYNFDKPRELIDLYLSVEWDDEWKNKWQDELPEEAAISTEAGQKEANEGVMKDWLEKIEERFANAAPRLLEKAKTEGFTFAEAHKREFERVVKESQEKE